MTFLIFVAAFVTLACVILPLATLAVFAVMRTDSREVWREPAGSREGEAAAAGRVMLELRPAPPPPVKRETVVT